VVGLLCNDERCCAMRLTYKQFMREQREAYFAAVLAETSGCVSAAAKIAGMNRTHFHGVLSRTGLRGKVTHRPRNEGNDLWKSLGS